jgi:TPP-dependent pyruvate/acetoin dehydrogenase alpha subunit
VASVLESRDYVVGHHRSHGHVIATRGDLHAMMAELLGRSTVNCRGLGGSMHIADLGLNILGCNGIVGAPMPIGCGAALASQVHGSDQVTVVFFGDGAANQGASDEAMNLAATWRLPVVFVCENNQFALSVDWRTSRAVEDIAPRAAGYGMPWEIVDGKRRARGRTGHTGLRRGRAAGRGACVHRGQDVSPYGPLHADEPP